MDLQDMSREELINRILEITEYMNNVIVFWGDRRSLRDTLSQVSENPEQEFSSEESRNASVILESEGAFEELIDMLRDSFERGGINWAISEKMSSIMETVAEKYKKN